MSIAPIFQINTWGVNLECNSVALSQSCKPLSCPRVLEPHTWSWQDLQETSALLEWQLEPRKVSFGGKSHPSHLHLGCRTRAFFFLGRQAEPRSFSWNQCHRSILLTWTKISFQIYIHKNLDEEEGRKEGKKALLSLSHDMHSFGPLIPAFLLPPTSFIFLLSNVFFFRDLTLFRYTLTFQLSINFPFLALTGESLF